MDALPVDNDLVDALRRLGLLQAELNELNELREAHNALINSIHRDLHDAAKLIGDVHRDGHKPHKERLAAHVAKHGHPQDVPESPEA